MSNHQATETRAIALRVLQRHTASRERAAAGDEIGIAEMIGKSPTGFDMARLIDSTRSADVGTKWMISPGARVQRGVPFLVTYVPDDQFVQPVPLAKLRGKVAAVRSTAAHGRDYRIWQALCRIADEAPEILEMVRAGEDLEAWQETRIELAAEYVDSVHDSLSCRQEACPADAELPAVTGEIDRVAADVSVDPGPASTTDPGAVRTRVLMSTLMTVLSRMGISVPGVDVALALAMQRARMEMSPTDHQRAKIVAAKLVRALDQTDVAGEVLAKALAVLLLDDVLSSTRDWVRTLEAPLGRLNLHLHRILAATGRGKAVQLGRRILTILAQMT